jgi:hypothetical protein
VEIPGPDTPEEVREQNEIAEYILGFVAKRDGKEFCDTKSAAWQRGWAGATMDTINDPSNWLRNIVSFDKKMYSLRIEDANGNPLTDFVVLPVEEFRRISKNTIDLDNRTDDTFCSDGRTSYRVKILDEESLRTRLYPYD